MGARQAGDEVCGGEFADHGALKGGETGGRQGGGEFADHGPPVPPLLSASAYHVRAYLALGLGVLCIAFSGIFISLANAPGAVAGFYRMGIATAALALPFYRQVQSLNDLPRRAALLAVLGGIFFAGDVVLWNTGVLISGATTPTLMGNTAPVWVGLGALIFFRERLGRTFWLGLLIAMGGVAVIIGIDAINQVGLGTFLGLLAGMFYGAYFLVIQSSRRQLDALTSFWLSAASATTILLLMSLGLRQPLTGYSSFTYLNLLGVGLVAQTTGQLAINYSLGHLPASLVSPTLLAQPVLTAVLAGPLLQEYLLAPQMLGGVAVIAGVYVVHRSRGAGVRERIGRRRVAPLLPKSHRLRPEATQGDCTID
ncbi:MAG TPA: DMT family transporter [Anaerolineae bacterium]